MPPDLTHPPTAGETQQEGNLLIEAVSLLVQRQRETETWVSEHLWQAEQRAIESERRYAELESRLAGIESHLARLVGEVEPSDDPRVARLREQIEDLKGEQPLRAPDDFGQPLGAPAELSNAHGHPATSGKPPMVEPVRQERVVGPEPPVPPVASPAPAPPPMVVSSPAQPATRAEVTQAAESNSVASTAVAPVPPRAATTPSGQPARANVGFLDLLGATREDRFGVVLIGLGGVAVLYALLTQLRFG